MARQAPRQPSPHRFGQVPRADIPRSSFDLSHGLKTTFDADYLIPVGVWDVIPGDSWNCKTTILARLATPLRPLMDNIYIDYFAFFVPYRILWTNFEKFMGAQTDPGDSIDYTIPVIEGTPTIATGDIGDYMGLPIGFSGDSLATSAMPFRAMIKIYNDWFRDENLIDSITEITNDGPDSAGEALYSEPCFKRAKKHDYFTSALPWPQKQTSGVSIPLGTVAPVVADPTYFTPGDPVRIVDKDNPTTKNFTMQQTGAPIDWASSVTTGFDGGDLFADLSTATAATINELRLAFQTQRLLERDARSGTRYVETLKAHWGVTFPDYTAQRPVYLGGGSIPVGITPVPQTTPNPTTPTAKDKQGGLAGFGQAMGQAGFTKSFVEHGVIVSLINARGDITYSQGIDRYWSKSTRYDFYYPVLSQIGEQGILNKEIWFSDTPATDDAVFGYTGRYNEYRFQNSKLTGLMRPDATGTLASWNLSEDFATLPTLGETFITSNTGTPLDRAIAVPSEPHFIADIWHDVKAARPLPLYGTPGGIDHF